MIPRLIWMSYDLNWNVMHVSMVSWENICNYNVYLVKIISVFKYNLVDLIHNTILKYNDPKCILNKSIKIFWIVINFVCGKLLINGDLRSNHKWGISLYEKERVYSLIVNKGANMNSLLPLTKSCTCVKMFRTKIAQMLRV